MTLLASSPRSRRLPTVTELGPAPRDWTERAEQVEATLARRHTGDPKWERASRQSELIGDLLKSGDSGESPSLHVSNSIDNLKDTDPFIAAAANLPISPRVH